MWYLWSPSIANLQLWGLECSFLRLYSLNRHCCNSYIVVHFFQCWLLNITFFPVKLLDWGEDGHRSEQEIAALRAAFAQEVAVWHKLDHPNVTKVTVSWRSLFPPLQTSQFSFCLSLVLGQSLRIIVWYYRLQPQSSLWCSLPKKKRILCCQSSHCSPCLGIW